MVLKSYCLSVRWFRKCQLGRLAQDMLEGLHIPSGLRTSWDSLGRAGGCGWPERTLCYFALPAVTEIWTQTRGRTWKRWAVNWPDRLSRSDNTTAQCSSNLVLFSSGRTYRPRQAETQLYFIQHSGTTVTLACPKHYCHAFCVTWDN